MHKERCDFCGSSHTIDIHTLSVDSYSCLSCGGRAGFGINGKSSYSEVPPQTSKLVEVSDLRRRAANILADVAIAYQSGNINRAIDIIYDLVESTSCKI